MLLAEPNYPLRTALPFWRNILEISVIFVTR